MNAGMCVDIDYFAYLHVQLLLDWLDGWLGGCCKYGNSPSPPSPLVPRWNVTLSVPCPVKVPCVHVLQCSTFD